MIKIAEILKVSLVPEVFTIILLIPTKNTFGPKGTKNEKMAEKLKWSLEIENTLLPTVH